MFPGCEPSRILKKRLGRGQGSVQREMCSLDRGGCIGEERPKTGKLNRLAKNNEEGA